MTPHHTLDTIEAHAAASTAMLADSAANWQLLHRFSWWTLPGAVAAAAVYCLALLTDDRDGLPVAVTAPVRPRRSPRIPDPDEEAL